MTKQERDEWVSMQDEIVRLKEKILDLQKRERNLEGQCEELQDEIDHLEKYKHVPAEIGWGPELLAAADDPTVISVVSGTRRATV